MTATISAPFETDQTDTGLTAPDLPLWLNEELLYGSFAIYRVEGEQFRWDFFTADLRVGRLAAAGKVEIVAGEEWHPTGPFQVETRDYQCFGPLSFREAIELLESLANAQS